ncbi:MAG TPA: lycopene cyclase family protein [Chitinophagaceae bacterium]
MLGAGCAGLSLLMRILHSEKLKGKKILLIDREARIRNDRTWCFWETGQGFFENIVSRSWEHVSFLSDSFSSTLDIAPYRYKMIGGIDFYRYCFEKISKHDNVEIVQGDFKGLKFERGFVILDINDEKIILHDEPATTIFSSIYKPEEQNKTSIRLLQHFKGWVIESNTPLFNTKEATLMDFRVHQQHGTSFAYVLPFSETRALIEYTLFTKTLLEKEEYDLELKNYIHSFLGIKDFKIIEEEFGVIPMTNEKLSFNGRAAWQIGTAGGQTKASSGYTFQFIQKQSDQIIDLLEQGRSLNELSQTPKRFRFYDNTLLHILYHEKLPGREIFIRLFQKNKPQQVLRFLDNETSLSEELKIISSLPTLPFLKAALQQI